MTNVTEITARLYAIGEAVMERTNKRFYGTSLDIKDGGCKIYFEAGSVDKSAVWIKALTPEAALDAADARIAAIPPLEDQKLHRHMARIADCVDQAREDGIADKYVDPLSVTIATITANLLPPPSK